MKECKNLMKYNSELWTCGINVQGTDGNSNCGKDLSTGEYVVYCDCLHYEPIEKKKLSIAEKILEDVGFRCEKNKK